MERRFRYSSSWLFSERRTSARAFNLGVARVYIYFLMLGLLTA